MIRWPWIKSKNESTTPSGTTSNDHQYGIYRTKYSGIWDRILYREMRLNIPVVDRGIIRLAQLNGVLKIEADSDRKQRVLDDFVLGIPIRNDDYDLGVTQYGINEYLMQISSMAHEQGFAVGEMVMNKDGRGVNRLQVPDAITFAWIKTDIKRRTLVQNQLAGQKEILPTPFVQLFAYDDRGGEYYSLLWNLENVQNKILRIWNSVENAWWRFGDPSILFQLIIDEIKMNNDGGDVDGRATGKKILSSLQLQVDAVTKARAEGKVKDAYQITPKEIQIEQQIIGQSADSSRSTMATSFNDHHRAFQEQMTVVTGLPGWMLNQHWSTTERLSTNELKMVLNDAAIRQAKLTPLARTHCNNFLQAIGKAVWREGIDYRWIWDNVDIADLLNEAQTKKEFENAEATRLGNIKTKLDNKWITSDEAKQEANRQSIVAGLN